MWPLGSSTLPSVMSRKTINAHLQTVSTIVLLLASFSKGWVQAEPNPTIPSTHIHFEDTADSVSLSMRRNSQIEIELDSNPTTGYRWQLMNQVNSRLKLVGSGSDYHPDTTVPGIAGRGGKEVFTFRSLKRGKVTLVFGYQRPWETDVDPIQRKRASIVIR